MGLSCGIVGLPNVGKSTIFNALSQAKAEVANYPFCTIDPNVGIVPIDDPRLKKIAEIFKPEKTTPNTLEVVDIAGLVKGASQGEGLGNKFLSHIRQVQAIIHVVRCFEDENVVHVSGVVDPIRDIETIETELALADLETLLKKIDRTEKLAKSHDPKIHEELAALKKARAVLDQGKLLIYDSFSDKELAFMQDLALLTLKPVLYVANVAEGEFNTRGEHYLKLKEFVEKRKTMLLPLCGKVEAELLSLDPEERVVFLKELGMEEPALNVLVREAFSLLKLRTFFTAGPKEVRAWTIRAGMTAPQAAGTIHSDFERGFICAEIYHFDNLVHAGSETVVKAKGLLRLEGREYEVQDGDIIFFRFNV
ncbi:MAG: redox-regulated ATPase YchF [Deltaproteobacteria bacterium]|nr:redox-regulated ATPase YchF [Deltaproteobacteria bacterium]